MVQSFEKHILSIFYLKKISTRKLHRNFTSRWKTKWWRRITLRYKKKNEKIWQGNDFCTFSLSQAHTHNTSCADRLDPIAILVFKLNILKLNDWQTISSVEHLVFLQMFLSVPASRNNFSEPSLFFPHNDIMLHFWDTLTFSLVPYLGTPLKLRNSRLCAQHIFSRYRSFIEINS